MIVTLLTDYGRDDDFVGVCHGVIRGIHPDAQIVDITHGIDRYAVRQGALVLRNTLPYMPKGVHVAVVDPQVGTERRAVGLRTADGRLLVGPDNGLLSLAWERCGGVELAVDVSRSPHRLEPVSATFHGRDIFAPVAARLAGGAPLASAGTPLEAGELVALERTRPRREGDALVAHVVGIDGYGNATLDAAHEDLVASDLNLGAAMAARAGSRRVRGVVARTVSDVGAGALLLYEDGGGSLALAVNGGDAAALLGLRAGDEVRLEAE